MNLYLVGGFLGSGKTTAIATAAKMLAGKKIVAVITNDQGSQLVDAAFIHSLNVFGREVKNGCFCCNYEQFYGVIEDLETSAHPDIVFAEAVGSCADLVATIVKPLNKFYPSINLSLCVFADGPVLLSSLEGRSSFLNENIQYIYRKQLQEAGLIVVNKSDLLTETQLETIESILGSEYPQKKLLFQDSRKGSAVKKWLDCLAQEAAKNFTLLSIDYGKYSAGEAALAWLDGCVNIHSKGNALPKANTFIEELFNEVSFQKLPIGHLKFFLKSGTWSQKISYTSRGQEKEHVTRDMIADYASILVNARVEANPDELKRIFYQALRKIQDEHSLIEVLNVDAFQPNYPTPTYRLTE